MMTAQKIELMSRVKVGGANLEIDSRQSMLDAGPSLKQDSLNDSKVIRLPLANS
jgi:hypothetical protein